MGSRRHRRGFWAVAFAFLVLMAFSTVPSPLYGLYRARDRLNPPVMKHGSVVGLAVEYLVAQTDLVARAG